MKNVVGFTDTHPTERAELRVLKLLLVQAAEAVGPLDVGVHQLVRGELEGHEGPARHHGVVHVVHQQSHVVHLTRK